MRLRLSKQADADLDEIWLYVARDSASEELASRVLQRIIKTFSLLGRFPLIGRIKGSAKYPDLRSYASGNFIVYYRVSDEILQIVRVVRGKRSDFLAIPEE
jgi:toxin ParE1/3/4